MGFLSDFQTPTSGSKNQGTTKSFSSQFPGVWKSDATFFPVLDIPSQSINQEFNQKNFPKHDDE